MVGGLINLFFSFQTQNNSADANKKFSLPKITLADLERNKINFSNLNQPTILFFWLPQSKTCRLQLEILSQLQENYTSNLKIIAVGIGALDKKEINNNIETEKINFPIVIDQKTKLTNQLEITTIPTLLFYHPTIKPKTVTGLQTEVKLKKIIHNFSESIIS
jgi:peroxiredoxin